MIKTLDINQYLLIQRIGRGRYGIVYQATCISSNQTLAIKKIDVPDYIHDYNTIIDVYTEITILQQMTNTTLYDYGISNGYFWIISLFIPMNLKQWRLNLFDPVKPSDAAKSTGDAAIKSTDAPLKSTDAATVMQQSLPLLIF